MVKIDSFRFGSVSACFAGFDSMFLISETVSLSSFISFSIFSSFSSFTASGFASSDFIFSCWFAETHVLHSKSMFMPISFIADNALLLSLVHFDVRCILHSHVMQSKDCSLALILLLQVLHVFSAIIVVFFISTGGAKGTCGRNGTGTQVLTSGT